MDCIFCKIASGQIQASLIHQDDDVVAFQDMNPQAPHHILVIPRKHIPTLNDLTVDNAHLISKMVLIAQNIAKDLQIDNSGYRVVLNCQAQGGQSVYHIHLHLLGGRQMIWPPG